MRDHPSAPPWGLVAMMSGVSVVSNGLRPLAGYRAVELGASALEIALLAAAFSAGALLLALPGGWLIDRKGPGAVIAAACALLPVATALAVLTDGFAVLVVSAVIYGVAQILAVVALQAATAASRPAAGLDAAFGWLTAGTSVGQVGGPLLALVLPSLLPAGATAAGLVTLLALSAVIAAAGVVMGLQDRRGRRERVASPRAPSKQVLRIEGMVPSLVLSGVALACLDLLAVLLPLWAAENDVSRAAAGMLLALSGGVAFMCRIGMGRLVRRFSRRALIVTLTCAAAAGMTALPFMGLGGAAAAMAVIGGSIGLVQPLTLAWVANAVDDRRRGSALALRMLSNRVVQVVLPLGVGAAAPALTFFGAASARSLVVSGIALWIAAAISIAPSWRAGDPREYGTEGRR